MSSPIFTYAAELQKRMGEEFALVQEAEYERAVEATNGYMSTNPHADSWTVFFNGFAFEKYASPELREHVLRFTRTTRNVFEQQWLDNYLGDKK